MTDVVDGVRSKLGRLTFRRVARVSPLDEVRYAIRESNGKNRRLSAPAAYRIPHDKWRQYGESHCARFEGVTSRAALRDLDEYNGAAIRFRSEDFAEFDLFHLEFGRPTSTTRLPRVDETDPRENNLLCGVVEKAKDGRLVFARWRPVSEQFFRMYTLCMYWEHSTFRAALKKKSGAAAYWFGGNRLVNGYAKYMKRDDDHKEAHERFWNVSSERLDHLHIYPAIVQVVRYGTTPFCAAVPQSSNAQNECAVWDLPTSDWANMFARHHGIWTEQPVFPERLGKGVRPVALLERETKGRYAVFNPKERPATLVSVDRYEGYAMRPYIDFVPDPTAGCPDPTAGCPDFDAQSDAFLRGVVEVLRAKHAPFKPALSRTCTELERVLENGLWGDE